MKEFVRDCDQTAVPVNLNYRGEGEHKTFVGGVASMIARAFILSFTLIMLLPVLTLHPDFNLQEKISFLAPVNNTLTYPIDSH